MAAKRRLLVAEDFDLGYGATTIPTDSGGTRAATKVGLHSFSSMFNVRHFGATGNGSTDDTAAIQAAIDAATYGAVAGAGTYPYGSHFGLAGAVYIPASAAGYRVSNLTVLAPIGIFGDSPRGSRLLGVSGATGYMLTIDGFNASASMVNSQGIPHVNISNLGFEGNNRQASYGAIYMAAMQQSHFDRLHIELFSREALNFYSSVLESSFSRINMRYCGNISTSHAGISLYDQHAVSGEVDAHNMLSFENIWSIFPFGHHVYLDTLIGRAYLVRDSFFHKCYFHGAIPGGTETGPTPTTAQLGVNTFKIGSATNISISDCFIVSMGRAVPGIRQYAGSHATGPTMTRIRGLRMASHGDLTAPREGIVLESGDITVDDTVIQGCNEGSIVTSSGTTVRIGTGVVLDEAAVFAANTAVVYLYGSRENQARQLEKRVALTDAATIATDVSLGNFFTVGFGATTRTIGAPTNPVTGQLITYQFTGVGGGTPTTVTWNAAFTLTGGAFNVGSLQVRTITFRYNESNVWTEVARTEAKSSSIVTLTDAATIAVDASLGSTFVVTLGGNRTLGNPTNRNPGQEITIIVIQDGTGGRTLAFDTAYKHSWSNTGNTLGLRSTIRFVDDSATVYLTQVGAQSPYMT